MTPLFRLDDDLKTIREMARMEEPKKDLLVAVWDDGDAIYNYLLNQYIEHIKTLKSYPAENFTPEYAGKELEEGREFEIMCDVIDGHPFAIPLSNTANPKGEESQCLKKQHSLDECKELCEGCFVLYKFGLSTPPTESEPDYWKKRCEAAEKLLDCVGNQINKRFVGYTEWESLKNQTHLQESKNKEQ